MDYIDGTREVAGVNREPNESVRLIARESFGSYEPGVAPIQRRVQHVNAESVVTECLLEESQPEVFNIVPGTMRQKRSRLRQQDLQYAQPKSALEDSQRSRAFSGLARVCVNLSGVEVRSPSATLMHTICSADVEIRGLNLGYLIFSVKDVEK